MSVVGNGATMKPNRSVVYVGTSSYFWGLDACYRSADECSKVPYPGVAYELLNYILDSYLGFDFVVRQSIDGKWGTTWGSAKGALYNNSDGILRDLLDNRIDLSVPFLDLTPHRFQAVNFTNVINFHHRGFLVGNNFGLESGGDFKYWKIMSASTLTYWLLEGFVLYVLIAITKVIHQESVTRRFALLCIYVLYLIMNASFGCFIISSRSVATTVLPFSTISAAGTKMLNNGFRLATASPSGAAVMVPAQLYSDFRKALDLIPIEITTSDANMVRLLVKYPKLFYYGNAEYLNMIVYRYGGVKCIIDESSANSLQGIMVSASKIGILKSMNSAIVRMQETGIYDAIMRRYDFSTPDPTPERSMEMATQTAFKTSEFKSVMKAVTAGYMTSSIYQVMEYGYCKVLNCMNHHI